MAIVIAAALIAGAMLFSNQDDLGAEDINVEDDWIPNPKFAPGNLYAVNEPAMIRNPNKRKKKKKAE